MGRHGKKRAGTPVRTGLLGVSAAAAVGAVAVATGLLPGGDTFTIGSSGNSSPASGIRTDGPPKLQPYGGTSAEATPSPSRTAEASKSPAPSAPPKKAAEPSKKPKPSATPSTKPAEKPKPKPTERAAEKPAQKSTTPGTPEAKRPSPSPTPAREKAPAPKKPSAEPPAPSTSAPSPSLTSAVFALVNEERALVGCAPVKESDALSKLARAHSDDMAARNYFDHTSPDGASPWTRADAAGITNLGAENIARGQADAGAVMNAWMESDGHRANILNCDFTTMGVGVHEGDGGPWWTQNFGY